MFYIFLYHLYITYITVLILISKSLARGDLGRTQLLLSQRGSLRIPDYLSREDCRVIRKLT